MERPTSKAVSPFFKQPNVVKQPHAPIQQSLIPTNMPRGILQMERRLAAPTPAALRTPITLSQLPALLREIGITAFIDTTALQDDGKGVAAELDLTAPNVSIDYALRHALDAHELILLLTSESLLVTTETAASQKHMLTVVYDISSTGLDVDDAINLFQSVVRPDEWDDAGGSCSADGINTRYDRVLIAVMAHYPIHKQVLQLLNDVARLAGSTAAVPLAGASRFGPSSAVVELPPRAKRSGILLPGSGNHGAFSGGALGGSGGGFFALPDALPRRKSR